MAEWYRSPEWNEEIEEAFFAKLARARSQRDQYIVIQALTLAEGFPEVALRLVDFYFETRTNDFDDGRARLAASRARFALGGYEQALDDYAGTIGALGEERDLHVGSPIQFAFLAARYRSAKHYLLALDLLEGHEPPPPAALEPSFAYHAAFALILHETGRDPAGARTLAEHALALPEVVLDPFRDVVWRLRGITRN